MSDNEDLGKPTVGDLMRLAGLRGPSMTETIQLLTDAYNDGHKVGFAAGAAAERADSDKLARLMSKAVAQVDPRDNPVMYELDAALAARAAAAQPQMGAGKEQAG